MTNQEIVPRQSMVVSIERLKGIITFLCVYGICRTIGKLYHIYIHCAVSMSMSYSIVVYPNNGYILNVTAMGLVYFGCILDFYVTLLCTMMMTMKMTMMVSMPQTPSRAHLHAHCHQCPRERDRGLGSRGSSPARHHRQSSSSCLVSNHWLPCECWGTGMKRHFSVLRAWSQNLQCQTKRMRHWG